MKFGFAAVALVASAGAAPGRDAADASGLKNGDKARRVVLIVGPHEAKSPSVRRRRAGRALLCYRPLSETDLGARKD